MRLGYYYRVQVSRMVPAPLNVTVGTSGESLVTSDPESAAHDHFSSCVTASTEVPMPTSLSLARIGLSCLRAIAVKHY
jgi:hypothetical protein